MNQNQSLEKRTTYRNEVVYAVSLPEIKPPGIASQTSYNVILPQKCICKRSPMELLEIVERSCVLQESISMHYRDSLINAE